MVTREQSSSCKSNDLEIIKLKRRLAILMESWIKVGNPSDTTNENLFFYRLKVRKAIQAKEDSVLKLIKDRNYVSRPPLMAYPIMVKMGTPKEFKPSHLIGKLKDTDVSLTLNQLIKVFGFPQYPYGDGSETEEPHKVRKEFEGTIKGLHFTIYDWKATESFETFTDWHVGGRDKKIIPLLDAYIRQKI